ncbi:MAG: cytochrome c biogenesis protein CcsA [Fimbriimonas sp.]
MKNLIRVLLGISVAIVTLWSFEVPDAVGFQKPELARIFFWHFPCAMLSTALLFLGAWFSFKFLRSNDLADDVRAEAANSLGMTFAVLTMITGILFSQVQWGTWWQWDPRQTSFLLVLLIYLAYFALRSAFSDAERRATNAAGYALAAILPALFLIFVFPRLPQVAQASFHPTQSIMQGQIKGAYAYVVSILLVTMSTLAVWLYRARVKAGVFLLTLEKNNERLETGGGHPTPTGVVRPVSVSVEDRKEAQGS